MFIQIAFIYSASEILNSSLHNSQNEGHYFTQNDDIVCDTTISDNTVLSNMLLSNLVDEILADEESTMEIDEIAEFERVLDDVRNKEGKNKKNVNEEDRELCDLLTMLYAETEDEVEELSSDVEFIEEIVVLDNNDVEIIDDKKYKADDSDIEILEIDM